MTDRKAGSGWSVAQLPGAAFALAPATPGMNAAAQRMIPRITASLGISGLLGYLFSPGSSIGQNAPVSGMFERARHSTRLRTPAFASPSADAKPARLGSNQQFRNPSAPNERKFRALVAGTLDVAVR
jgi:hypothetical protein